MFEQRAGCLCYRGGAAGAGASGAALGAQAHHPRRHDQTVTAGESTTEKFSCYIKKKEIIKIRSEVKYFLIIINKVWCSLSKKVLELTSEDISFLLLKAIKYVYNPFKNFQFHLCLSAPLKKILNFYLNINIFPETFEFL